MPKKLTIEFVKGEIEKVGYRLLSREYENNYTKLNIRCDKGHYYKGNWANFNTGRRCPICTDSKRGKRLTIEYIKYKTKELSDSKYGCLSNEYINNCTKLLFECNYKHEFEMTWGNFQQGKRCSKCLKVYKYNIEEIKEIIKERADGYECLSNEYKNCGIKLLLKCDKNHKFEMSWSTFNKGKRCSICYLENRVIRKGKDSPFWRGGSNVTWYNTYAPQLKWCEEVRRDPENSNYLQVKCTESSCRKWFSPTNKQTIGRVESLNFTNKGTRNLYCSELCKKNCNVYNQQKYPKGQKPYYERPLQKEWREMILKRDNDTCQICNKKRNKSNLIAHHFEGLNVNPIMSADLENGITLCKKCDKIVHSKDGCRPIDLTKERYCGK